MATHLPPVLSQTSQYAIQALIHLSAHRVEEPILGAAVAEAVGIPANYLAKIMHALGRRGIVEARRGRLGGYRLIVDPAKITLMDVYAIFDDARALDQCFLGLPACSDEDPCEAHEAWGPIRAGIRTFLVETTLESLVPISGRLSR